MNKHISYINLCVSFCRQSHLQFDVESRLVELQLGLEAERVKLLGDDQRTLSKHKTHSAHAELQHTMKRHRKYPKMFKFWVLYSFTDALTSFVRLPATFCSFSCCVKKDNKLDKQFLHKRFTCFVFCKAIQHIFLPDA